MRIGCCLNMNARDPAGIGLHGLEAAARAGCDYVELPLAQIMSLDRGNFRDMIRQMGETGVPCRACNNFVPATVRLTGPDTEPDRIREYVVCALERAQALGAEIIVFGSSQAKNIPAGFPVEKAWEQIMEFLYMVEGLLDKSDILIAVEPLCRQESNLINTVREGFHMVRETDQPHIRLLADYYHMVKEDEPVREVICTAGPYLCHAHTAVPEGRRYPHRGEENILQPFFDALAAAGYNQGVSIEGVAGVFGVQIGEAVEVIRSCIRKAEKQRGQV